MKRWTKIKLMIKYWWLNLFSEHKITPRYKERKKYYTIDNEDASLDLFELEDLYE